MINLLLLIYGLLVIFIITPILLCIGLIVTCVIVMSIIEWMEKRGW